MVKLPKKRKKNITSTKKKKFINKLDRSAKLLEKRMKQDKKTLKNIIQAKKKLRKL